MGDTLRALRAPGEVPHALEGDDAHACVGEYVGLDEIDDGVWNVYFGALKLGRLLERQMKIEDAYGRLYRHR